MMDADAARAVMGNHEFNAIAWATPDPLHDGLHLRPRHGEKDAKNRKQHQAFLAELEEDSAEYMAWIDWFLGLPLWIEESDFRVVHACWSPRHVRALQSQLAPDNRLTRDLVAAASRSGSVMYEAVETILKGIEVKLPEGHFFSDKDGIERREIRTKWWNPDLATYRSAYMGPPGVDIPDIPLPLVERPPEPDRPTFIGHYWFRPDEPVVPAARRVACVDYSVANRGPLVDYRFDGEAELTAAKFETSRTAGN